MMNDRSFAVLAWFGLVWFGLGSDGIDICVESPNMDHAIDFQDL